ncbi:transposase [uncultured Vagococcus sp.]|uniref:transposase n=1 Tax=uncultured Vagococcus sp. TaxID=189676 RepID=UPI0037DDCC5D
MYNQLFRTWKKHYKDRPSIERVNAYLKDNYRLNSMNYFIATRVVAEHHLTQLAYNLRTICAQFGISFPPETGRL